MRSTLYKFIAYLGLGLIIGFLLASVNSFGQRPQNMEDLLPKKVERKNAEHSGYVGVSNFERTLITTQNPNIPASFPQDKIEKSHDTIYVYFGSTCDVKGHKYKWVGNINTCNRDCGTDEHFGKLLKCDYCDKLTMTPPKGWGHENYTRNDFNKSVLMKGNSYWSNTANEKQDLKYPNNNPTEDMTTYTWGKYTREDYLSVKYRYLRNESEWSFEDSVAEYKDQINLMNNMFTDKYKAVHYKEAMKYYPGTIKSDLGKVVIGLMDKKLVITQDTKDKTYNWFTRSYAR